MCADDWHYPALVLPSSFRLDIRLGYNDFVKAYFEVVHTTCGDALTCLGKLLVLQMVAAAVFRLNKLSELASSVAAIIVSPAMLWDSIT